MLLTTTKKASGLMQYFLTYILPPIGLALTIFGLWLTIRQIRSPNLEVICNPPDDGNPASLNCEIRNTGRGEAKHVSVSFTFSLPLETNVLASPEVGARIVEAQQIPDPHQHPASAALLMAFRIEIPRVAAKDTVKFRVTTANEDNQRAAKHIVKIRREISSIITELGSAIKRKYPDEGKDWNTDLIISARIKGENLFRPGRFSYEKGRKDILYITEEEQLAMASEQDLVSRYKKEFINVFQNRPEFKAPVIRVRTPQGDSTYAIFPPHVRTSLIFEVSRRKIREAGGLIVYPPVPKSYD